jgi:molybdate transport system substrate-binding protein
LARNTLEIVVAPNNPKHVTGLSDLARADLVVVLEDPSVPAGNYSRQVLARAGVKVKPRSLELDVKSALGKVTSGEADAAMVYVSDALAARSKAAAVPIPDDQNVTATYPIAVVKGTHNRPGALAFVDEIVSGSGRRALASHGFLSAP